MNSNTFPGMTITRGGYTICKALILTVVFQFLPGGMTDSGYCNIPNIANSSQQPAMAGHSNISCFVSIFQNQFQNFSGHFSLLQIETSLERLFETGNSKETEENKSVTKKTIPPTNPVNQPDNDEDQLAHLHDHNEEEINLRHPAIAKLAIMIFFTILILFRLTPLLFT